MRAAAVRHLVSFLITLIKIFSVVSFHDSSADFNKGESHLDAAAALSCQQIMMNHIPPIFVLAWPCPASPRPNPARRPHQDHVRPSARPGATSLTRRARLAPMALMATLERACRRRT